MEFVKNGGTRRIAAFIYDADYVPLTAKTVQLWIRRRSDWYWFTGSVWQQTKPSAIAMSEAGGSGNGSGFYYYDFVLSGAGFADNEMYFAYYVCTDTDAASRFGYEEIQAGGSIDLICKLLLNYYKIDILNNVAILYDTNKSTELARWQLQDENGNASHTTIFRRYPL